MKKMFNKMSNTVKTMTWAPCSWLASTLCSGTPSCPP